MTEQELQAIRERNRAGNHLGEACEWDTSVVCPRCEADQMGREDRAALLAEVERLQEAIKQLPTSYQDDVTDWLAKH